MAGVEVIALRAPKSGFTDHEPPEDFDLVNSTPEDASSTDTDGHIKLDRYLSLKPVVALGLTLQASWEVVAITFQSAFLNGGPVSLVYGMIIVTIGSVAIALTLGEMAAIDPTVGAQYRWTFRYAPKSLKPQFWGFMQGWLTLIGWIAACASSPFSVGIVLEALIQFNYATYVPQRWHATLIMWAAIVLQVAGNLYARRILVSLEVFGGLFHIIAFLATVITLGVLVPRNSSEFVWKTSVSGISGWNNAGVAFCIGLLSPASTVSGCDGIIHMSDETKDAAKKVPRAMLYTVLINGVVAFAFTICLLYFLGDPAQTLDPTRTSLPFITVLLKATGSKAATNALMSFLVIVLFISGFNAVASVSRLTWAFAKDGGLPFSNSLARVHPTLKVPANALYFVGVLCALLALINIGSTVAFYAILSLALVALFISYLPPTIFHLICKLRDTTGPRVSWQLGRFGIIINIFAVCYSVFMITWLPFPTSVPVTRDTMNYAGPVWCGCVLLALLDYFLFGHKRFRVKVD